tara:strand:+ start:53 stop:1399 length:1347 start_codon:yes stop_codon:yes gene_type:complete
MKVKVTSKKGLKTSLSVLVDKKIIQNKLDEKLEELKDKVHLKGFRPGKVPPQVIKNQFGKAIYGEVIDGILKETSTKAIEENKLKVAGQPKIDLKTFGEGKNLDYTIEVETLPEVKLKSLDSIKFVDYEISVDQSTIDKRIDEISKSQQNFSDKSKSEVAKNGDMVIFDYNAKINGKSFEGGDGKNLQIVLGRDLFIKGFDNQLIGVKINESKVVKVKLPPNYPKKELANQNAEFNCKINNLKKPIETKIDDDFAKKIGAKNLKDLKDLVKKQITGEYKRSLDSLTKKNLLDQIEKLHTLDLPPNLVNQETKILTQNLKKEDIEKNKEKNEKIAKSRIKIGIILNEIAEKNNLKVNDEEIKNEIQKQIRSMPGQEKMIMDYYKKNSNAAASLKGALYEEKIIDLLRKKSKSTKKTVSLSEAEEIIKKNANSNQVETKTVKNPKNKKKK